MNLSSTVLRNLKVKRRRKRKQKLDGCASLCIHIKKIEGGEYSAHGIVIIPYRFCWTMGKKKTICPLVLAKSIVGKKSFFFLFSTAFSSMLT